MGSPVLAVGSDRVWRVRIERMLSTRGELDWLGSYPTEALCSEKFAQAAVWLVDGDDPAADRACSRYRRDAPIRMVFYRHPDAPTLRLCARNGASACLDKQASADHVLRAIGAVGTGLFALDRALLAPDAPAGWSHLTPRQQQTVHWALRGLSNKQIGRRLGISPETVKTHLHNAFEREGIDGRRGLLAGQLPESQMIDAAPRWSSAIEALRGEPANRRCRADRRCGATRRSEDPERHASPPAGPR